MKENIQKYRVTILFFSISLICYVSFYIIGSEIDKDGYLKEPFGLIPIGALFFFASIMSFAWIKIKK
ncbi:MAG: DUF3955 domain-containing protein [Bacteroidetes bacterium]|jgi:hypothetical protein|nr:DUF3955 domain-containing protein [Bacteroidota bacterium]MDA1018660.1 DUF3955 domain-containing protein [Bacteroidota bacterium]|tara:strand:- start:8190 stop:8390 length:201 start_codon:yes stop_codon:yes gene_type:complete